jgi:hypothetical protein
MGADLYNDSHFDMSGFIFIEMLINLSLTFKDLDISSCKK